MTNSNDDQRSIITIHYKLHSLVENAAMAPIATAIWARWCGSHTLLQWFVDHDFPLFWVNYNISLTWIKAIWGWFPLLTMIPVRSQWGRYNLPRLLIIIFPHVPRGKHGHLFSGSSLRTPNTSHPTPARGTAPWMRTRGPWQLTAVICGGFLEFGGSQKP